jgi:uncharacterized membrane protein YraQ (UPF0718 family)
VTITDSHAAVDRPLLSRPSRRLPGLAVGAVVLAALITLRVLTGGGTVDLPSAVQDGVTLAVSVIIESLPFVILGIALSLAVQVWVPDAWLIRVLPRRPLPRRLVLSLLGVLLPVCECGNMPLARGLMARGLTVPEATTFLLAAPIVNPITILTTYQAFGFDDGILAARVLGGFVIANLVGVLLSRHPEPWTLVTPTFAQSCTVHAHDEGSRVARTARGFAAEATAMVPALFIGSAVAGIIQVAVSRDALVTLGQNPVWSVLALMCLAFVIALCSNVDAYFILAFGSTFLPGSIIAFLVLGPMIDIKMLALMRTTYTARTLVLLTSVVGLLVLVLGLGVNALA